MKTNFKVYGFLAIVVVAIGAFLYYFFKSSLGTYTLDIRKEYTVDGSKVVFKAKAKPLKMELNDPTMFDGEKGIAKEVEGEVLITIESEKKVNCTYDLIYVHDEEYIRYTKTESKDNEFTISYDGSGEAQLSNFDRGFTMGSFTVSGPLEEESKKIKLRFYNIEEDQAVHVNTVYQGNLRIDNIKCY